MTPRAPQPGDADDLRGGRGRRPRPGGDQLHVLPGPDAAPDQAPGDRGAKPLVRGGLRPAAVLLLQPLRVGRDRRAAGRPLARRGLGRRLRGVRRPLARDPRRLRLARLLPAGSRLRLARGRPDGAARGARPRRRRGARRSWTRPAAPTSSSSATRSSSAPITARPRSPRAPGSRTPTTTWRSSARRGDPAGADVAVTASNRCGMVYRLGDAASMRASSPSGSTAWTAADVVLFPEDGFAVARREGEELRFRPAEDGWELAGDADVLDERRYPNGARARLARARLTRTPARCSSPPRTGSSSPTSAGAHHVGGGSHGSLVAGDSTVPLVAAGFDEPPFGERVAHRRPRARRAPLPRRRAAARPWSRPGRMPLYRPDFEGLRAADGRASSCARAASATRGVLAAMGRVPREEFLDLGRQAARLRRHAAPDRLRPDDLAAVHGRAHDPRPPASRRAIACSTSAPARATARPSCASSARSSTRRADPRARRARRASGSRQPGYGAVHVHVGDGCFGLEEFAPFDAIIVGRRVARAAASALRPARPRRPARPPGRQPAGAAPDRGRAQPGGARRGPLGSVPVRPARRRARVVGLIAAR